MKSLNLADDVSPVAARRIGCVIRRVIDQAVTYRESCEKSPSATYRDASPRDDRVVSENSFSERHFSDGEPNRARATSAGSSRSAIMRRTNGPIDEWIA